MRHLGQIAVAIFGFGLLLGCGASSMDAAMAPSGVTPGGSQDVGYFRSLLRQGLVPEADDITLEGFLSEHDIPFPQAECQQVLCLHGLVGHDRAVAEGGKATFIQLAMGTNVDLDSRPRMPVNMAVVVDVSGSMASENKLQYVKDGLLLMVDELGPEDRLALVKYSSEASVIVPSQHVTNPDVFKEAIYALQPEGSTNLYDGMVLGYEQVLANQSSGTLNRVMLLSDGLANAGVSDSETILVTSGEYNNQGIGITTIGVGMDFNQELMRELSEQGGGNFYFIEDPSKATTVFKDELDFLLTPLANNLRIVLSFADGFTLSDAYGLAHTVEPGGTVLVEVPTVFASRKGGAILLRIDTSDALDELEGIVITEISYSYEPLADDGTVLAEVSEIVDARVPALENGVAFDDPAVHKSLVLWNMVQSIQAACREYHELSTSSAALAQITALADYVDAANEILEDEEIARDRAELINQFAINLGGYLGEPYYYEDQMMYDDMYYGDDISYFPFGCATTHQSGPAALLLGLAGLGLIARRTRQGR